MSKGKREMDIEFYEAKKKKEYRFYDSIDIKKYKEDLPKPLELWEMDPINAALGVTKKLWWEPFFKGKFTNKKILDVGCGNCYHVPYWSMTGNDVVGLDSSKTSLKILKRFLKKLGLNARLKQGFSEDMKLKEKFDIINFNNMLHHVEDMQKSLINAKNVLRDDGYLLVVEPIYYFLFRWIVETDFLKKLNPFRKYFAKKDLYYDEETASSRKTYIDSLKNAGFKIIYLNYDKNFFGYALTLLGVKNKIIKRFVFYFDNLFTYLVPKSFRSFVYIIAKPIKQVV